MKTKIRKPYTVKTRCSCCTRRKNPCHFRAGQIKNANGDTMTCPYCDGAGWRDIKTVHPSHKMGRKRTEILAPCGTPRFYTVRECSKCGRREEAAAAGHFFNGLEYPCTEAGRQ